MSASCADAYGGLGRDAYGGHNGWQGGGTQAAPRDGREDQPGESGTVGRKDSSGKDSRSGGRHPSAEEEAFAKFKEAVVELAKPVLKEPFQTGSLSRDGFKQILKKVAEKVVASYKKEGVPPPADNVIDARQGAKITKLVQDYLGIFQGGK